VRRVYGTDSPSLFRVSFRVRTRYRLGEAPLAVALWNGKRLVAHISMRFCVGLPGDVASCPAPMRKSEYFFDESSLPYPFGAMTTAEPPPPPPPSARPQWNSWLSLQGATDQRILNELEADPLGLEYTVHVDLASFAYRYHLALPGDLAQQEPTRL
jgi:hypothetical protein